MSSGFRARIPANRELRRHDGPLAIQIGQQTKCFRVLGIKLKSGPTRPQMPPVFSNRRGGMSDQDVQQRIRGTLRGCLDSA
jgi:hypothetical protein